MVKDDYFANMIATDGLLLFAEIRLTFAYVCTHVRSDLRVVMSDSDKMGPTEII